MYQLVLVRHGQSVWNRDHLFAGWTDVDLTAKGAGEARAVGKLLKQQGLTFNIAFTSLLKRAIRTSWILLDEMDLLWIPVIRDWRLNERHYGALQGLNKARLAEEYGEKQVKNWRRGFDVRPPALTENDPRFPGHDRRYRDIPRQQLPTGESLRDTVERLLPAWNNLIMPAIRREQQVLIVAHENSLRALVKVLEEISDTDISDLDIPRGIPRIYELDRSLKVVRKS
ncbi:phosphoglycerate mutase [Syntrophus gentianae]|uniref:2,3-bisphosphoglycerate-dependent phosphoglycerate mutase n=1 Tax=Syntrophus gentianae TaxID=43775 RepID=A0A1H7UX28_9BACT|nr:2,3-diphosphoglycerate-dependent phosphoglycerate mutase [Syntrophus gentianae]SEM01522.1 phosphoglycerate mutase [Syntrophus gentianae]